MNLHFTSWRENAVVQTFLTKSESQNFGNYLIQILNRAGIFFSPWALLINKRTSFIACHS